MTGPISGRLNPGRPFKLGFLTHVHGAGRPAGAVYRDLVELFVAAEELGFDGGWIAQHHLRGDYGRLPSPFVALGAVAARTRRIELGTAVTVLPLEDPVRLAEDVAVLDALSGGRVQLGLGTGGANIDAFGAWGLDPATRHERFDAALARLRAALAGEPLADTDTDQAGAAAGQPGAPTDDTGALAGGPAAGGFGSGTGVTGVTGSLPRLQPARPALAGRLWQATSDPVRAAQAGADGDGLLLGTAVHDPLTQQRPLAEAHRTAWNHGAAGRRGLGPDHAAARDPSDRSQSDVSALDAARNRDAARDHRGGQDRDASQDRSPTREHGVTRKLGASREHGAGQDDGAGRRGARDAADSAEGRPPVAVIRAVFPAADKRAAAADLAPALAVHKKAFVRHGLRELAALTTEEYLARINVHYGHPDEVTASIQADPALLEYATYFVPVVQHEASTVDADIRRLEIIAREIAPALGWRPASVAETEIAQ